MGGRGATSSKGASSGASAIKATNAKFVENMNEVQIKEEIKNIKYKIIKLDKQIDEARTPTQYEQFMAENFPLGVGVKDKAGINRLSKSNEKSLKNAIKLSEALREKENATQQLKLLEEAQKEVQGTGKTQKEIQAQQEKAAIKNLASTRKWTKIQDQKMTEKGGYTPRVIQSGDYKIQGSDGLYTIYKNDTMLGRTDKLAKAKAHVEAYDRKK